MNASDRPVAAARAAVVVSYGYGLVTAAVMGYFLLGIPIQFSDSFGNMLALRTGMADLLQRQFYQEAFLRPFLWAELKLVFDASQGDYFTWFRGVHVAQVFVLVGLFLALVRPSTWLDAALVPLGLAVLLGIHTFEGTVFEAFPVNTYMTILLCCLAAANLSLMRHRWWVDVAAVALFVIAALTVESGLLVWVIAVGAAMVGARGVSRTGLGTLTGLLIGYFVLRFAVLDVGSPDLLERSSGFGLRVLEPDELAARFGGAPWAFYAYNVVTSAASVLFGEPRAGVFGVTARLAGGTVPLAPLVTVAATTLATALVAAFLWLRRDRWWGRTFERDDQLVALFLMVLAANAVISYPYTKDVIMSPAGMFFAAAVMAAARGVLLVWDATGRARAGSTLALSVFCLALGGAWAVREIGTHLNLRVAAQKVRNEWAYADEALSARDDLDPDARRLFGALRDEALTGRPIHPQLWLPELRVFDVN